MFVHFNFVEVSTLQKNLTPKFSQSTVVAELWLLFYIHVTTELNDNGLMFSCAMKMKKETTARLRRTL